MNGVVQCQESTGFDKLAFHEEFGLGQGRRVSQPLRKDYGIFDRHGTRLQKSGNDVLDRKLPFMGGH